MSEKERIRGLLNRFISGEDRSVVMAGEIESAIAGMFPENEFFDDFIEALASYKPSGGPFLYDEREMVEKCRWALGALETVQANGP